jgi:FAD:protein FMN transferase
MRACRPLLGTYVEIRIDDSDPETASVAVDAGFRAISEVQRLMSVFDENSDIGRINRLAHREPVSIAPWTQEILALAGDLHRASEGLFDCGIAPQLGSWGLLPDSGEAAPTSSIAHLAFTNDGCVTCSAPTRLDLGGIAKGFAVDRAAEAILATGAKGGTVNAGSDLRVFGNAEEDIHLRAPDNPEHLVFAGRLRDGACATSATYYSRHFRDGIEVSPLVDPRNRQALVTRASFSVIAPHCVIADALTKVLALSSNPDLPCFSHYQAHPFIVEPSLVLP